MTEGIHQLELGACIGISFKLKTEDVAADLCLDQAVFSRRQLSESCNFQTPSTVLSAEQCISLIFN
jgi:hypothetical protein